MAVKPLEKFDKTLFIKFSLITILIATAIVLNKIKDRKREDKESVLSITKDKDIIIDIQQGAQKILNEAVKKSETTLNEVLGEATNVAVETASKSAEAVKDYVFDATVGNLIKQIDKLPEDQKEDIKRNICK